MCSNDAISVHTIEMDGLAEYIVARNAIQQMVVEDLGRIFWYD